MRYYTRNSILAAISILAILLLCPALQANGIISNISVSGGYAYTPTSGTSLGKVGPYWGTVTGIGLNFAGPVFCLDGNVTGSAGSGIWASLYDVVNNSTGFAIVDYNQTATLKQREEEAAFLATYALSRGAHATGDSLTVQSNVDGPTQYAIWQEMGTNVKNGTTYTDNPAASSLITLASNSVLNIPFWTSTAYLKSVSMWIPITTSVDHGSTIYTYNPNAQRFVTGTTVPEPGTMVFLGTGVLLLALSRIRRRR